MQPGRVGDHRADRNVDEYVVHREAVVGLEAQRRAPRGRDDLLGGLVGLGHAVLDPLGRHHDDLERAERHVEIHQVPAMLGDGIDQRRRAAGARAVVGLQTHRLHRRGRKVEAQRHGDGRLDGADDLDHEGGVVHRARADGHVEIARARLDLLDGKRLNPGEVVGVDERPYALEAGIDAVAHHDEVESARLCHDALRAPLGFLKPILCMKVFWKSARVLSST